MSVTEILNSAKALENKKFEKLYRNMQSIRAKRSLSFSKKESEIDLLNIINQGFDEEKMLRLQYLDWKLEFGSLTESEEKESLKLAKTYEKYSVDRLKKITQLAALKGISIDELMMKLGINQHNYA